MTQPIDGGAWSGTGGRHTAEEILSQPSIWRALAADLGAGRLLQLDAFLGAWLQDPSRDVILTGAGSSAFVGEIAADEIDSAWPARVRVVHSTSLLTHPALYLRRERPTLLVSFARSGSSPESLGAVDTVRGFVAETRFLNITCNPEGELARRGAHRTDTFNLLMPEGSNDRGFAMTSSFTAMLLAVLAALSRSTAGERLQRIERLAELAETALREWTPRAAALAGEGHDRIVYLGSGPLESLAKEAALKVLELTGGRALALANTPLGFRHGPKSALTGNSLVVVFRSADAHARAYECDLLGELRRDDVAARVLTVGPAIAGEAAEDFSAPAPTLADAWLAPLWLAMAQQFALHKSAALGLTPDNPFPDGTVNRVVQGVTLYPYVPHAAS